ncbi:MAG: MbnP family protein, partial [Verrucomicrobiota bacterium]
MKSLATFLLTLLAPISIVCANELNLEFNLSWKDSALPLEQSHTPVRLTRTDLLLSQFALQKPDGTWLEASQNLIAFLSFHQKRTQLSLGRLPEGNYQALRFLVGLEPQINKSDPNLFPPDHPLNPQLNNLHWTWQTGYIFLALEGYSKGNLGFLYHLGNDENATTITLPTEIDASQPSTLTLNLDLAQILSPTRINISTDTSTHSREGDPIAAKIKTGLATAFTVKNYRQGTFHSAPPTPSVGTPTPPFVSTHLPKVSFPADNPLSREGIALGRKLFFDPILSLDESISCASCHAPEKAFTDPAATSLSKGIDGRVGTRNSMPLFNLAWHTEFFWDGRKSSLREQVLDPISDPNEMGLPLDQAVQRLNEHPDYPTLFQATFGSETISPEPLALALEQYLLSLTSQDTRFDRALRGEIEFTEEEKRGFHLFVTEHDPSQNLHGADCFHCHGGALLTNHRFINNGLLLAEDELGYERATGKPSDRGKFKVPSLRNLTLTAPYMHDGRFQTLEEVIEHYNSGVHRSPTLDPNLAKHPQTGLNLNEDDKKALLAFL